MSKKLLRRVFSVLENVAEEKGYRIRWFPPQFLKDPKLEMSLSLEFVLAHLMLRKRDVYFIQIGANDGMKDDPLQKFVKEYGWKGILVEPIPEAFEALTKNYGNNPNLKFINAAIAEEDGVRTLYSFRRDTGFQGGTLYSSFRRDVLLRNTRFIPETARQVVEVPVKCLSMASLLREAAGNAVDLLLIDTEGFDFNILKMIDFSVLLPPIIAYEHAHLSKSDMIAATELLLSQGYRLTRDNLDTIAYRPIESFAAR
jgi:FkbM family methyltransferase